MSVIDMQYAAAVGLTVVTRKCSTSFIQRHLELGYNAAARLVERMEDEKIVARPNHVGKREVLLVPATRADRIEALDLDVRRLTRLLEAAETTLANERAAQRNVLAQLAEERAGADALARAVKFYASNWSFKANKKYGGLEWFPAETLLDDCGNAAKEALAAHKARRKGA